ncbi:hypothetical protein [Halopelagius fulvigenes]|uniref:DUF2238 domain-containing protein n=1 Tax=Halopelagius fulvigenes TaxID=1198324 RepID=A0ABD5U5R5_9EURY
MTEPTRTPTEQTAERGIKGATLAVFVEGLRQRDPDAVVNAVLMFAATYLPSVAERLFDVEFRPWQRVYTEISMLAHAVGILGPYDDTWWWDHVTHVLSATLLGGFVHVAADHLGRNPRRDVLASIVGGGLLWEIMEYAVHRLSDRLGIEPVLVYYGRRDTVEDLLFDLLGALFVLLFGDRLLRNFTRDAD